MSSNWRLKGWRCPYQSSPNIYEAVENEHSWYLQRNATATWRSPRTRWEVPSRERRTSLSSGHFTFYEEPRRSRAVTPSHGLFLSRTRSVPESLHCLNSPTLHPRFSSVTISARSLSPNRDRMIYSSSRISPVNLPGKSPTVMAYSDNKTLQAKTGGTLVPPRCKAIVVTVTECTEHHSTIENTRSSQAQPAVYQTEQTDSSSSSKIPARIFRSCAHLEVLPFQLSTSTLYLDKSLSVPLGQPQKDSGTLHRSTLSFSLGRRKSSNQASEKFRIVIQPKRSYSDWDIASIGFDGKEKLSRHLMDTPTFPGSAFRKNTISASNMQYSTLTSLSFRTRCHSSSSAFRLNGKANDVLGPPQSNLRARHAFSKRSDSHAVLHYTSSVFGSRCTSHLAKHEEPILSKIVDSPAIFNRMPVSVEHLGHRYTAADPVDPERNALGRYFRVPQVHVRAPREVRTVSHTAGKVRRVTDWSVSPHLINCTCASSPDQQDAKHQSLSLREALEMFRPDFVCRSQNRVQRLERRARERHGLQTDEFVMGVEATNHRRNCTKPHPLSDNLFKPRDRAISGKEMQWRSRRIYNKLPEVTKKKEDERKRLVSKTNRQRAEVFNKKLLDQVLQRHSH